jgi:hypothetical protein
LSNVSFYRGRSLAKLKRCQPQFAAWSPVLPGKKQFRPDFLPDKARGSSDGELASPEMLAASGDEPNSSPAAANSSPEMFRSSGEAGGAGRVTRSASPEPLGLSFEKFAGSPEPERGSGEPDNFAPNERRLSPDETAP